MVGDEKATISIESDEVKQIEILFNDEFKSTINSIHDKVMLQMLEDSERENDEPLRLIEMKIWNPKTKTAEFDVNDSTVLQLMYGKQPMK